MNTDVISWVFLTTGMATLAAAAIWILCRNLRDRRPACRSGHPSTACRCPRYQRGDWDQAMKELIDG